MPLAALRRGVNVTNWFRYPPSEDRAALAAYLPDEAIVTLRRAGFDFIRLAVQPEVVRDDRLDLVVDAVRRLQREGLAVVVGPHTQHDPDRAGLLGFWGRLAPRLREADPRLTVPEVLNEPVFADDAAGWATLQRDVCRLIRRVLPGVPVLLTGNAWGGIDGLLALRPLDDPNTLYSFHFYEPPELTSLAAYQPRLDRTALARMPFPVSTVGCASAEATTNDPTRDLVRFVCAQHWDAAKLEARIAEAAAWGRRHGVRVVMGEFGASAALNAPARLRWLACARSACEANAVGWALWGYDDVMGFAVRPGAPPLLDPDLKRALGLG